MPSLDSLWVTVLEERRGRREDSSWPEALNINRDRGDHVDDCYRGRDCVPASFGCCTAEKPGLCSAANRPDIRSMKAADRVKLATSVTVNTLGYRTL
jgi:hypothetical protein